MTINGSKVLVTGGAGFIGSHLVEVLLARNACVTVIDDLRTGSLANIDPCLPRIEFIQKDFCDPEMLEWIAGGTFDVIFHLAANAYVPPSVENPMYDFELNMYSSLKLIDQMRQSGAASRLVYMSSAAVYGNPVRNPITEDDLTIPISPYGVGKLAVERYVHVFAQLYEVKAASARPFSVYGVRQRKQIVYDLIQKLRANPRRLMMFGDGTQERDFSYVSNVTEALIAIAERGELAGEVYNLASGQAISTRELALKIASAMGLDPVLEYTGNVRAGDPDKWQANIDRSLALGYSPSVCLEEGIQKVIDWCSLARS